MVIAVQRIANLGGEQITFLLVDCTSTTRKVHNMVLWKTTYMCNRYLLEHIMKICICKYDLESVLRETCRRVESDT